MTLVKKTLRTQLDSFIRGKKSVIVKLPAIDSGNKKVEGVLTKDGSGEIFNVDGTPTFGRVSVENIIIPLIKTLPPTIVVRSWIAEKYKGVIK